MAETKEEEEEERNYLKIYISNTVIKIFFEKCHRLKTFLSIEC
jgi:hypothetical protein